MKRFYGFIAVILLSMVCVSMAQAKTYVVRPGDYPVKVAKKMNVATTYVVKFAKNGNPRRLYVGTKIPFPNEKTLKSTPDVSDRKGEGKTSVATKEKAKNLFAGKGASTNDRFEADGTTYEIYRDSGGTSWGFNPVKNEAAEDITTTIYPETKENALAGGDSAVPVSEPVVVKDPVGAEEDVKSSFTIGEPEVVKSTEVALTIGGGGALNGGTYNGAYIQLDGLYKKGPWGVGPLVLGHIGSANSNFLAIGVQGSYRADNGRASLELRPNLAWQFAGEGNKSGLRVAGYAEAFYLLNPITKNSKYSLWGKLDGWADPSGAGRVTARIGAKVTITGDLNVGAGIGPSFHYAKDKESQSGISPAAWVSYKGVKVMGAYDTAKSGSWGAQLTHTWTF